MQRVWKAAIVALAVVVVGGAIDLAQPLAADQSLFLVGAREMAHGAVLYRDFWDLKQPGIYDFYYAAGTLGGFSALAVHVFELVYLSAFAVALTVALSRSRTFAAGAPYAAIFAIAWYYVIAQAAQQLQVEALAGFPLFMTAWLSWEGARRSGRSSVAIFAAAGVAGGVALLFKLIFAPLVVLLFGTALVWPESGRPPVRAIAAAVLGFLAGAALPLGATLAVLAAGGALPQALDTWFAVPPQIVASLPEQQRSILFSGITWFARGYAAPIFLALCAIVALVRSRTGDALARALFVWLVAGIATVLSQRTSWWAYQWFLLAVPIGCFAAAGLATLVRLPKASPGRWALALAAVLALLIAPREARKIVALAQSHFALTPADREAYRGREWSTYGEALLDRTLLPEGASVYVMGDPVYYVVTDRTQPLATNGWSMELLLPAERAELLNEFRARPPAYVYITHDDGGPLAMMARSPAFAAYFAQHYRLDKRGLLGKLYRFTAS